MFNLLDRALEAGWEVIIDGVTGFLVPPDDVGAAAGALQESAKLSRRECRHHAVAHLDLERSLDMHESLFRRVAIG